VPAWSLLSVVGEEQAQALRTRARRRRFRRGEVVFHRGDLADTMHLVTEGCVAIRVHTRLGDVATLEVVAPGGCFGELALLRGDHRRSATAQAIAASETLSLSAHDLIELRQKTPDLDQQLIEMLGRRVMDLSDRLVDALYTPATRRVRQVIDELAAQYRCPDGSATIPLTHDELASLAGSSRLTVERVLHELRESGRVRTRRGQITVDG
jgi:CRP/FNR family transcriptional regulator, cyclic AMP receptor protein